MCRRGAVSVLGVAAVLALLVACGDDTGSGRV